MTRAVGAVVAHFPDTEGVTSSNLVSPTKVEAIRLDITEKPSIRAIGAAASALRSHRRGRRFDSYIAHLRFALASYMLRAFLLPLGHSVPQRTISRTIFGDEERTLSFLLCSFAHLAHLPDADVCISGATGVALPQSESCWLTQLARDAILCETPNRKGYRQ